MEKNQFQIILRKLDAIIALLAIEKLEGRNKKER